MGGQQKEIENTIKDLGLIPIDIKPTENKILVIEMNYLPTEYKDMDSEEAIQILETKYGCKVLFIDGSRANVQGNSSLNFKPAYFI